MTRNSSSWVADIEEVRTRFEQWRQTRQGKTRIPDELWSAAVEVARRDGVGRTAAALRLDGNRLKQRLLASNPANGQTMPPAFVEWIAPGVSRRPEYTIELEGRNGKLRIHCQGATAAELAELSRALWEMAS
jgi:hypothetical protein